jgi:hypothetical protein
MSNAVVHTVLVMDMMPAATAHLALNCPYTMQKPLVSVLNRPLRQAQQCLMV